MTESDWLDGVPEGWTLGRLKNLTRGVKNGIWGSDPEDGEVSAYCVRAADFDRASRKVSLSNSPLRGFSKSDFGKQRLQPGDLIIEKSGGGEKTPVGSVVVFDLDIPAVCSNFCARITPSEGVDSKYLSYVFSAAYTQGLTQAAVKQTTGIQNLDSGAFFATLWSYPDEYEQRRIADFLDAEVMRVIRISDARRSQLQALEECEMSLISERFIPGSINRASGEFPWPWLPRTSEFSPLVRLGYLCQIQGGVTVDASRNPSDADVTRPYLRVANVKADRLELDSVTEITVPKAVADRSTLQPGDVLMTEGGDIDKLGRGTVWSGELPGALHQNHVFALRPDPERLDAEYLALLTRSLHGRCYFEATGVKSTNLASTSSSKVKSFPIPFVSLEEQRKAVVEVNDSLAEVGRLRVALIRQIELLEERKRALITAAVTGQIDVTTARGADVS